MHSSMNYIDRFALPIGSVYIDVHYNLEIESNYDRICTHRLKRGAPSYVECPAGSVLLVNDNQCG